MKSYLRFQNFFPLLTVLAACWMGLAVAAWLDRLSTSVGAAERPPALVNTGNGHDWPMFGGTDERNMFNPWEKNLPSEWNIKEESRKNIKWVAELGSVAHGGPVVADGKVFLGTNNKKPRNPQITEDKGILMCFREADGQFLWQAVHDKLPNGMENDWPEEGIASTPVVEGKRLYYVSNACEVICAGTEGDGKNAVIIWRLDMIKELNVYPRYLACSSPLIAGDLLYVVTGNGVNVVDGKHVVVSPKAPSFLAINKNTGKVVWQDNSPGEKIMDGQWANPAYAVVNGQPQVIFPGGDGWLYGLEATTGKLIWKFDCNPKASEYHPLGRGTRNYFLATPVVYDNKVYIGVGRDPENDGQGLGHLLCVDITKTGDLSPVNDNFDPKAEVNKNSGLVWHYGGPAPKGGERDYLFGRTLSTCAIHDDLVYAADLDGFLYCLDAKTGQKYWQHDFKTTLWSSPSWVDGKVYIGNEDGDLSVFAPGKEEKLLGKMEMVDAISGPAVAANGVLYVQTAQHLYAIAQK